MISCTKLCNIDVYIKFIITINTNDQVDKQCGINKSYSIINCFISLTDYRLNKQ